MSRSHPVLVKKNGNAFAGAVGMTAGLYRSFAWKADGSIWAWGSNYGGLLGLGTASTTVAEPTTLPGFGPSRVATGVSVSNEHALARIADGSVWSWGWNYGGKLGIGPILGWQSPVLGWQSVAPIAIPTPIPDLSDVSAVAAGDHGSGAIDSSGRLWTWGNNVNSSLGHERPLSSSVPRVVGYDEQGFLLKPMIEVAGASNGYLNLVSLDADGTVWTWGSNWSGSLGDGSSLDATQPTPVRWLPTIQHIAAGSGFMLALDLNGTVWAWGGYRFLQNSSTASPERFPVKVKTSGGVNLAAIKSISATCDHSLAVSESGNVWAWGKNGQGQIGDGSLVASPDAVQISTDASGSLFNNVVQVAAGLSGSLARKNDGSLWGWGNAIANQSKRPKQIFLPNPIVDISAGTSHYVVLDASGKVWSWGMNENGQVGPSAGWFVSSPVQVPGLEGQFTAVCAGISYSLALRSDGTVWAWGSVYGYDGITTMISGPFQMPKYQGITNLGSGHYAAPTLRFDGSITTWGLNFSGEMGTGGITMLATPTLVAGLNLGGAESSITLVSPSSGSVFSFGTPISLSINAATPGTSLARVDYFYEGAWIGSSSAGESGFPGMEWTPPSWGQYKVRARAATASGHFSGFSNEVNVTIPFDASIWNPDMDDDQIPDAWEVENFNDVNSSSGIADPDGDGVSNIREYQLGLSPRNPDSDFDGISDGEELLKGSDPLNPLDREQRRIAYFPFDAPSWKSAEGALPSSASATQVRGFKGKGVEIDSATKHLVYPWIRPDGRPNFSFKSGTVRFWFKPNWSSPAMSGRWSRMLEFGWWTGDGSLAFWALHFKASEPGLFLGTHDGSYHVGFSDVTFANNLIVSGKWHQMVATYSPTHRKIFINGQLIANQAVPWDYDPDLTDIYNSGMKIASDAGDHFLDGVLDELEVFNYPLSDADVSANYSAGVPGADSEPDGMPDVFEQQIVNHSTTDSITNISQVLPEGDFDNDGVSNLDEWLWRINPTSPDSDGDGIRDKYEIDYSLNPADPTDALEDFDNDDVPNVFEYKHGWNPLVSGRVNDPANPISVRPSVWTVDANLAANDVPNRRYKTFYGAINAINNASTSEEYAVVDVRQGIYKEQTLSTALRSVLILGAAGNSPVQITEDPLMGMGGVILGLEKTAVVNRIWFHKKDIPKGYDKPAIQMGGGSLHQQLLVNCIVSDTDSNGTQGAAVYVGSSNSTISLVNCTLIRNKNRSNVNSVSGNGKLSVVNSVIWSYSQNGLPEILFAAANLSIRNSLISGQLGALDPRITKFGEATTDSPILNRGQPVSVTRADMHGELRPFSSGYDLGADEFVDSDSDGLPDKWEIRWFGAISGQDGGGDLDGDRLVNRFEYEMGLNPTLAKTDVNGKGDLYEALLDTANPCYPESWRADRDEDGLSDGWEIYHRTNNEMTDTNADGISDGASIAALVSATSLDVDSDGIFNSDEVLRGTSPFLQDTDGDGVLDLLDVFPLDPTRSTSPTGVTGDTSAPLIVLDQPANAIPQ